MAVTSPEPLVFFASICDSAGLRSGEELGSDDAHHHRHGGRADHKTGLQPRRGGRQPAVWRGALLPKRLPGFSQR